MSANLLPRPVVYWDENTVAHPALIMNELAVPESAAHILATLFVGPVGQFELFDVPYCDAAAPRPRCWSEIA